MFLEYLFEINILYRIYFIIPCHCHYHTSSVGMYYKIKRSDRYIDTMHRHNVFEYKKIVVVEMKLSLMHLSLFMYYDTTCYCKVCAHERSLEGLRLNGIILIIRCMYVT